MSAADTSDARISAETAQVDDCDGGVIQGDQVLGLELLQREIDALATDAEQVGKIGLRSLERQLPAVRPIAPVKLRQGQDRTREPDVHVRRRIRDRDGRTKAGCGTPTEVRKRDQVFDLFREAHSRFRLERRKPGYPGRGRSDHYGEARRRNR